jgi:putative acetyltransferase
MLIRPCKDKDLADVLSTWQSASQMAHAFLGNAFLLQERSRIQSLYLPQSDTWVAEAGGELAGFISLMGSEVGGLFVRPERQHMGVGRALLDKAREIHGDLEVEVFEENLAARKFYLEYGFEFMQSCVHPETGRQLHRLKLAGKGDAPRV